MKKILLGGTVLALTAITSFAGNINGSSLTQSEASKLTQDECATLVGPSNIPDSVISSLPSVCVNNMGLRFTNNQLEALTGVQISTLSFDWLRAAGQARQVVLLAKSTSQAVFRIVALNMLSTDQIKLITPRQLQGLSDTQLGLFSKNYLKVLTDVQMQVLRSGQISAAFDKWTDQQMRGLTPAQIKGLPATQTNGLLSYFTSWSNAQIHALTPAQLAAIPHAFGYPWFSKVLNKMSTEQTKSLTNQAIFQLAKYSVEVQTLPDSLISSLSDNTVVSMAQVGYLSNLSDTQLSKLSVSAVWNLKLRNMLGQLSENQRGSLPSTDLTLTATLDRSCKDVDMTLGKLRAVYSTQITQPTNSSEGYTSDAVSGSGQFTVPRNATFLYFNRDFDQLMPTNINFYGVIQKVTPVTANATFSVACRTTSANASN